MCRCSVILRKSKQSLLSPVKLSNGLNVALMEGACKAAQRNQIPK